VSSRQFDIPPPRPHVAHDNDLEGVLGVLERVRQIPPLLLDADVLLPLGPSSALPVITTFTTQALPFSASASTILA